MIHKLTKIAMALAILSLSACSLFGGSDPLADLREQVRSTVHDQERADAMLASVDQLDQLLLESAELLVEVAQRERLLFKLHSESVYFLLITTQHHVISSCCLQKPAVSDKNYRKKCWMCIWNSKPQRRLKNGKRFDQCTRAR
jgi:hypothetical protein